MLGTVLLVEGIMVIHGNPVNKILTSFYQVSLVISIHIKFLLQVSQVSDQHIFFAIRGEITKSTRWTEGLCRESPGLGRNQTSHKACNEHVTEISRIRDI